MSDDGQQLLLTFEARFERYMRNFERAQQQTDRRFKAMENRAKQAGERMERDLRNSTANITKLLGGLGVGLTFNELKNMADTWTDLTSRVNNAVGSQEQGAEVMDRLGQIARRTYSDISATTDSFVKNSQALKDLGYSTATQLDYTEALNNALVISNAKGQQAESIQNALAKAMADGELKGQNLNTVIQSGGRVAQALADALGTTVTGLRTMSKEGKLTGDVIVKSLTGEIGKLREEADDMPATFSDSMVIMRNALTSYVGKLNEARGITAVFSGAVITAADNIDSIAAAAAVAGIVILGRYVPALTRATAAQLAMIATNPFLLLATAIGAATYALHAFGGEIRPVEGDLASLHDYAGAAWETISNGAMTAGAAINDSLITAINYIADAIGGAEMSFADLGDFVKMILNQIVGEFSLLYDTVVIAFTKLPQAIAEAVVNAMNSMISGIESGLNGVIGAVNSTIESINGLGSAVGVSLGTIGTVTLGRITNAYEGAGAAAGEAYGQALRDAAQDHIGNALGSWRDAANQRATDRLTAEANRPEIDSTDKQTRPASAGASGGGRGGRGGGKDRGNEFDRQVAQLQQRIAAIRAETEARRGLTGSVEEQEAALERARLKHELLTAAQNAGLQITPELEGRIAQLADAYSAAAQEAKGLADAQADAAQRAQDMANFGGSLVSGFISDLRQGKSASEALAGALGKIVDKMIDMAIQAMIVGPLMKMFGFSNGGLVGDGGGTAMKLASGGKVRGPGTSTSDSIPAMLSDGEFVVNAAATSKHGALLAAINDGRVPAFRDGGYVGEDAGRNVARLLNAGNDNAGAPSFTINAPVTVNGSAGTPEQNTDLARKMAKQMEQSMRGVVADEMRRQTRPGNMLNSRSR